PIGHIIYSNFLSNNSSTIFSYAFDQPFVTSQIDSFSSSLARLITSSFLSIFDDKFTSITSVQDSSSLFLVTSFISLSIILTTLIPFGTANLAKEYPAFPDVIKQSFETPSDNAFSTIY